MHRSILIDDARIAFEQRGTGPAVLLVHGFPFDKSMWSGLAAGGPRFRRVAPDLRGFGASTLGSETPTMARYADDLVGLLDALHIELAVVCALSMGGYVAFELVHRHPERVRGLVLMDTRADADSPEGREKRDEMAALVEREGMGAVAQRLIPRLLAPGSERRPAAVRHLRRMMLAAPPRGVVAALRAMRDRSDATDWLLDIRAPTLVIAGEADQLTPPDVAIAMCGRIPGARCAIIPGAGHVPPIERPRVTGGLVRRFLEDTR